MVPRLQDREIPKIESWDREANEKTWWTENLIRPLIVQLKSLILVEKKKEELGEALDKQQKKKIERDEERLKNNNRDLSLVKMKSMWVGLWSGNSFRI